jgi:hypothetical protein
MAIALEVIVIAPDGEVKIGAGFRQEDEVV